MNGATNARNTVIRRLTMSVGANNGETADTPVIYKTYHEKNIHYSTFFLDFLLEKI